MDSYNWIKLTSWHMLRTGMQTKTLCGRAVGAHPTGGTYQIAAYNSNLPYNEKSCESCLRLASHDKNTNFNPNTRRG